MRRLSPNCSSSNIFKNDSVIDCFTSQTLIKYATLKLTSMKHDNNKTNNNGASRNVNVLVINGSDNNNNNNTLYSTRDNITISLLQGMCTVHCRYMQCWHEPSKTLPLVISFLINTLHQNMNVDRFTCTCNHTNKRKTSSNYYYSNNNNINNISVVSSCSIVSMAFHSAIHLITHYYTMCSHIVQNKQIEELVNTLMHCALLCSFDETLYTLIASRREAIGHEATLNQTFNIT